MNQITKISRPLLRRNCVKKTFLRSLSGVDGTSDKPSSDSKKVGSNPNTAGSPPEEQKPPRYSYAKKVFLRLAGFAGLVLTTGYVYKNRRDHYLNFEKFQYRQDVGSLDRTNPTEPEEIKPTNTLRKRYNFINAVVKKCVPAVFFLEIRDPNKKDVDGKPLITSNGSGFIINEDGWALTNAHVVLNKTNSIINAILRDGKSYPVTVEDVDMNIDLALLKLDTSKQKVSCLKLAEDDISIGEWVVALGSPLSLSNSVTVGIISCVKRPAHDLGLKNLSMSYIQTDAAITFGNSGGPLVNLDGDVVGINNLRLTSGISFAIPVEYAKKFLENTKHRVKNMRYLGAMGKSLFGLTTIPITPDVIKQLEKKNQKIPKDLKEGLLVWKVVPGAAASKGGLKVGDIITHVNGIPVKTPADLYLTTALNQTIEIELLSQGKKSTIYLTPEMFEENEW